jgi:hypothetical protein
MASQGERVLTAELLVALATAWIADVAKNKTAPTPSQILGVIVLYALLAIVAMFGDGPARFASALGALVIVTIVVKGGPRAIGAVVGAAGGKIAGQPQAQTQAATSTIPRGVLA